MKIIKFTIFECQKYAAYNFKRRTPRAVGTRYSLCSIVKLCNELVRCMWYALGANSCALNCVRLNDNSGRIMGCQERFPPHQQSQSTMLGCDFTSCSEELIGDRLMGPLGANITLSASCRCVVLGTKRFGK